MASTQTKKPRNRRLDPELRKQIILDATADLVAREGVSAVSMERVGREAGVSKALVYAYFKNQTNLLQQLLLRAQQKLSDMQAVARSQATSFDELIRLTTGTYLKHVEEDGLYVQRLMHEPSVAAAFRESDQKDHQRAVETISKEITRNFAVPRAVAALATELSMGMTGAAGDLLSRGAVSREKIEDINLTLLKGAMQSLVERYGKD